MANLAEGDINSHPIFKCLQFQGSYCLSYQINLSQLLSLELCRAQPELESIKTRCGLNSSTTLYQHQELTYPIEYKSISSCHLAHQPPEMLTLASFQQKGCQLQPYFFFSVQVILGVALSNSRCMNEMGFHIYKEKFI